jgi:hypothetical protein
MLRVFFVALLLLGLGEQMAAAELSLKRVMLSSGGVGYFEFAADIDGDATLGLDVPVGQVDDILKSLVVFDAAGGVAGVELPGRDNTIQAFGDAPFGPGALDSPSAYLNALRGTEVTVQGPRPMTGRIVRAELVTETIEQASTQRTRVTLLGTDGLRQFVLEDADSVQVTDPELRVRIERALQSLRNDSSLASRHLTVRIKGKGQRTVAVGYVAGAPLWKATYRLMLPADNAPTARLQGWATLENQSGSDWKSVSLTLQYGNPVTFRQALYRSYFVQRPEVPVEILGRVLPDIDTRSRGMQESSASAGAPAAPAPAPAGAASRARMPAALAVASSQTIATPADAALANETAEETIFTLAQTVDLAAGHSTNVPIIDREVPAPRIGLVPFLQRNPLASVRIRNDDSRSLPAGVLTLYDTNTGGISFAGDARLGGLPSGETRLLSFSRDLRTLIETKQSSQPDTMIAYTVADGVLTYTVRVRRVFQITAIAPVHEARELLIEIPKSTTDQTLTVDDGNTPVTEQTAIAFRIALSLTAGQTRAITAWLDQPIRRTVTLIDGDDVVIQAIVGEEKLAPTARAALRHVLDLRQDETRKAAEVERQRKLLEDVLADEDRIRKNLAAVTAADPLRSRLTRALDADETKIEQLRKSIDEATAAVVTAHRALTDAVTTLRI